MTVSSINPFILGNNARAQAVSAVNPKLSEYKEKYAEVKQAEIAKSAQNLYTQKTIIPSTEDMQIAQEFANKYGADENTVSEIETSSNPFSAPIPQSKKAGLFQSFPCYDGELHPVTDNQICIA